jgi:hypothetical protein
MRKTIIFLFILFISFQIKAQNQNLLSGKYSKDELKTVLIPLAQWTPSRKQMIAMVGQKPTQP